MATLTPLLGPRWLGHMKSLGFLWSLGLAQAFAGPSLGTEALLLGNHSGIWNSPADRTNRRPPAVVFGAFLGSFVLAAVLFASCSLLLARCSLLVMGLFNQYLVVLS